MPVYNSAKYISACIESIRKQTFSDFELIIVDRGSIDGTKDLVKSINDSRIKYFVSGDERTSQFNYGVKNAHGTYLYYCGSDFILDELLLEQTLTTLMNTNADAALIVNKSDPTISFWSKVRSFERDMYTGDDLMEATRFFKRVIYEKVGGYDNTLVAYEEHDLHNRIIKNGYKVVRITGVKELHIGEPKSIIEVAKKHYYYGKTINRFIKKDPERAMKIITPLRPSYFKHWKEFLTHPYLSIGFIIYQSVRYTAAGIGFIVAKID